MGETTAIEWAHSTFNPWIGCQKVGPGCDHCYAESFAKRTSQGHLWGPEQRRRTSAFNWREPAKWDLEAARAGVRKRVFCASLADVFDNAVDPTWRRDLLEMIGCTTHLDFLLLTKRIGNAGRMLDDAILELSMGVNVWEQLPWPNVWLGATVVCQSEADRDVPKLLATPARLRFLSMEPLLGPVNLEQIHIPGARPWNALLGAAGGQGCSSHAAGHCFGDCPHRFPAVDWVIVGGESGHDARPMNPVWVRRIRDDCAAAGVPFLFKQWGEWAPVEGMDERTISGYYRATRAPKRCTVEGVEMLRVGKKIAGRLLDGVEHNGFPVSPLADL